MINIDIKNIYNEIAEMMYKQFSYNSSVEHCKGYILEDVLELFEKKFPDLKRMSPLEYRESHPLFIRREDEKELNTIAQSNASERAKPTVSWQELTDIVVKETFPTEGDK